MDSGCQWAFEGVVDSPILGRYTKPRISGRTMVIDKGLGLSQTRDLMELAAEYIDFVKLGFGTAALYTASLLRAKIDLIRSYGVAVYPGGTFLETALVQGALRECLWRAQDLGFTHIEVSDGTVFLSPSEREKVIRQVRDQGFLAISEVGKKDTRTPLNPEAALRQIQADLEAGVEMVIVEGRESGRGVGLFDPNGALRTADLERLLDGGVDPSLLMWEAPLKEQQMELIARLGPNVNLGNIPTEEVLAVESLRRGLRGDTLRLALDRRGDELFKLAAGDR